ncbi:hypothetical protein MLD38_018468 [Melastoma candidum]|uniref:Uncharacterized protein n=1 Tax=Melastoma candidum TaxID=119954 RepID=A0ACB9QUF4_9MYRT|nr:hypothetical protein MLD38_018468 [Melastoma candidum]
MNAYALRGGGGGRAAPAPAPSVTNVAAAASALDTINAAAAASMIASRAATAAAPPHPQKKRWRGLWKLSWCFGFRRHQKRIGHAILSPEAAESVADAPATLNFLPPPPISLPFVAPPSSPASFIPSEPPSAAQSPTGLLSFTSMSANIYSPPGPHSMFAIGPYAHETQLVSPPVFSTFTTQPSTAPVTPPSESMNMTTPASPEVPFAQFIDPNLRSPETGRRFPLYQYEFQPYQLSPGSPVGHRISPSSGISGSGTSSPFPGSEIAASLSLLKLQADRTSSIFDIDASRARLWGSTYNSGTLTPDSMRPSPRSSIFNPLDSSTDGAVALLELPTEDSREGGSNPPALAEQGLAPSPNSASVNCGDQHSDTNGNNGCTEEASSPACSEAEKIPSEAVEKRRHQRRRSITLGSSRDFTFEEGNGKEGHRPPGIASGWSGETFVEEEHLSTINWSFPVIQSGTS